MGQFTLIIIKLLLTLLLLLSEQLYAIDLPLTSPTTPKLYAFADNSDELNIQQIQQLPDDTFEFVGHAQANLGRGTETHWVYFDWVSDGLKTTQNQCISIDWVAGGETDLYLRTIPNQATKRLVQQPSTMPVFCFEKDSNIQSYRFYLRLKHYREMVYFTVRLHDTVYEFSPHLLDKLFFLYAFAGGFFAIGLYHFVLLVSLEEKGYTDIVVFSFVFCLVVITRHGLLFEYERLQAIGIFIQPVLTLLTQISVLRFTHHLMDFEGKTELAKRFLTWSIRIALVLMPILVFLPNGNYLAYWFGIFLSIPLLVMVFYATSSSASSANTAIIPMVLFSLSVFPWVLAQLELIEAYNNLDFFLYIGVLLSIITMATMEVYRTRDVYEEAEQVRTLNKAKDSFLATMTHELRTPMHTVMGIGELLNQRDLPQQHQQHVQQLNTAANHMLNMIDDVLDLAKLEHEHANLVQLPFKLDAFVAQFHALFEIPAKQKGISFEVVVHGAQDIYLLGDQQRLTQVIINLVGNALKFTETGGVQLIVHSMQLRNVETESCRLRFEVCDTGIGISESDQQYLFNAFYQVQSNRARQYKGTGLGLAISQRLIKSMGSELQLYSQPDEGSCFYFTLELSTYQQPKQDTQEVVQNHTKSLEKLKILLVDDDLVNAELGKLLLEGLGAHVIVAHSGYEAIEYLKKQKAHIVFMDVSMPVMDGYQTTKQIRTISQAQHTPIIALTAHVMAGESQRCLEAGMNDYLAKPFSLDAIREKTIFWCD